MAKRRGKPRKVRVELRKNVQSRERAGDLTRRFEQGESIDDAQQGERVSGKGRLTRKRTVMAEEARGAEHGEPVRLEVDRQACQAGVVTGVLGPKTEVRDASGQTHLCVTRRLLKSLSTDRRNVVAVGDRVLFRPLDDGEGVIERVEPRISEISRTSRNRRHVIVANVDRLLIVASAAEPTLKPNLIDRMLITAERAGIQPIICVNKIDLVDLADLQGLIGVYAQLGYQVLPVSAATGRNIDRLRRAMRGRQCVVAGQSGVGKSSLLNAIEPGLQLKVSHVSRESQKGRHTTTAARLIPLEQGGFVVDTPGIRQFQLWDVIPEEVAAYFRDLRPYVSRCRFPDCTHTHESHCAVKHAVADGRLDVRRYDSYCHILDDDAPA